MKAKEISSLKELKGKIKLLGLTDKEQIKNVICSLIGHSRIHETWFGYHYCGRCGAQLGDTIGSIYPFAEKAVVIGHNCDKCKANYLECTWKDKYLVPNPFIEKKK